MYHEWECPDCGHELHHECETEDETEDEEPETHAGYLGSGLARCGAPIGTHTVAPGEKFTCRKCQADKRFRKAFNDPSVACCGRDAADCDCPPEVPCLCHGPSHYEGCPNWELPY